MTEELNPPSGQPKPEKLPDWLKEHFRVSLDAHDKLIQIGRLSAQGISMHLGRPGAIRALAMVDGAETSEETRGKLEQAEGDAALARAEIDEGFPVLHSFIVMSLWSWLEDFTKGLMSEWLLNKPSALHSPAIHKLKVRLGDYLLLSKEEQSLHLVELLEQDLGAGLKQGATRFTALLDVIGLPLQLTDDERRTLFEFQAIRNNLAHRNGRVDNRVQAACPWLKMEIGQPVKVSRQMVVAYSEVSAGVLLNLLYSAGDQHGINLRPEEPSESPNT